MDKAILFPVGGLHRKFAFQQQPPFTTPDCRNVRPSPGMPGRAYGGTRPGLLRHTHGIMPSSGAYPGETINMLGLVEFSLSASRRYVEDDVEGFENDEHWSVPAWLQSPTINTEDKLWFADHNGGNPFGLVRDPQEQDPAEPLSLKMLLVPYRARHQATYRFYLHMDNTTPAIATKGVEVRLTLSTTGGSDRLVYEFRQNNVSLATSGSIDLGYHDARWFRVRWIPSSNTVALQYGPLASTDNFATATQVVAAPGATETRWGWSMAPTASGDRAIVDCFHSHFRVLSSFPRDETRTRAVIGCGGHVLHELSWQEQANNWEEPDATKTIRDDIPIESVQRKSKLYIADYDPTKVVDVPLTGANKGQLTLPAAGPITLFTVSAVPNFVTAGVTTSHVVEITAIAGAALPAGANFQVPNVYRIAAVAPNLITLVRQTAMGPATRDVAFNVRRGPKVYDPAGGVSGAATLNTIATTDGTDTVPTGILPLDCPHIAEYRSRLVFAKGTQWFMSRPDDPLNYDYGVDPADPGKAVSGTAAEAGEPALNITGLIAFSDEFMLFGTGTQMFQLRGDPAYRGKLLNVSRSIGLVSGLAWCLTDQNTLYFMSRDGPAIMLAHGTNPQLLHEAHIPHEMQNLDPNNNWIVMCYDPNEGGILIFITGRYKKTRNYHWFYELANKGFWPFTLSDNHEPMMVVVHKGYNSKFKQPVMGGRDGVLRYFSRRALTDDSEVITSKLALGPFRAGATPENAARIDAFQVVCSERSLGALLTLHAQDTPEQVGRDALLGTNIRAQFNLVRGFNVGMRPYVRGAAFALRIFSKDENNNLPWGIEVVNMKAEPAGPLRPSA